VRRKRIGMITPSSNTTVEPLTTRLLASLDNLVTVHFTRIRVTDISRERSSLDQFSEETLLDAARLLADAHVDVIAWNGTSGSWRGVEGDRALARTIEADTGIPATTSTLDLLEACRHLGVSRCGLATPYLAEVHERIRDAYAAEGLAIVSSACLGISANHEFAEVPLPRIEALLRAVAVPDAQGIVVACTNFPALSIIPSVEQESGRPVVDSLAATAWRTLRLVGIRTGVAGSGRLLASE
jgi:maleate isomerase